MLLSREIVNEIASKPYCSSDQVEVCKQQGAWFDTNFGGTSLGIWLSRLENVHVRMMNKLFQFVTFTFTWFVSV